MRYLMWFTFGFALSCGLGAYGGPAIPGVFLILVVLICCIIGRKRKNLRKIAVLSLGILVGGCWYQRFTDGYLQAARALDGQTKTLSIRVTDLPWETDYGLAGDGSLTLDGRAYRVRFYLDEQQLLFPGDRVSGSFRFRLTTRDGAETYHPGEGIFLLAYQAGDVQITQSEGLRWQDYPVMLRRQILNILDACFPADTAPFAKALLLGDTTGLSYEVNTALEISGIRHVVAVSGLHVSILFALLSALTFHKRYLTALVGFPALFFFAAVAGFTPSVSRSCLMWALILLSLLTDREYDGPTALSFAVLVLLLFNPLVITSVSFQLSVSSVAGIFAFSGKIYGWMMERIQPGRKPREKHILVRWLCTSVSVSLGAMVFTTPLCAWYFGTISLIGVLTNLLTLWLISLVFYGCMAVCLLSFLWTEGAALLAGIVSMPIRYILITAKILASFPLAAVYTRSPYITAWLVFVYLLLAVFIMRKNRKPGILACCASLGLCFALLASYAEPMLDDVRFTVLDVGQGQCLLLQSQGKTYMVDCGGSSDSRTADLAAETLLSQGVTRLDGLILTHTDRDHAGAAQNLLSRVETDLLILPPRPGAIPTRGETVYASRELEIAFGSTLISIYPAHYPGNGNENSLCVLFESEKCDILITGDRDAFGERSLLRHSHIPDVDILMAGHHGSKYSTCDELLRAVKPEIVIVSAGQDNPYGHPAPELLKRLKDAGCQIYRTDQNGTILIRR